MSDILLLAAGGLARETLSSIRQAGADRVTGILDDAATLHGSTVGGVPVLGGTGLAAERPERLLLCAGSGATRLAMAARLAALGVGPGRYATHRHPSVVVGERCRVGSGSILLAGSVLTCDVRVGRHVVLMPRTVLTHDDELDDGVTCAAGVTLAGRVSVGARAYLGMQASVRQDLRVGADAVLGMGAVALRAVPDGAVWVGNPAAPLPSRVRANRAGVA
jgi:sugar O-acyltransferase (sialic acid O-acetyltransferase NeuD family)